MSALACLAYGAQAIYVSYSTETGAYGPNLVRSRDGWDDIGGERWVDRDVYARDMLVGGIMLIVVGGLLTWSVIFDKKDT